MRLIERNKERGREGERYKELNRKTNEGIAIHIFLNWTVRQWVYNITSVYILALSSKGEKTEIDESKWVFTNKNTNIKRQMNISHTQIKR